jgi:hypothetical protein
MQGKSGPEVGTVSGAAGIWVGCDLRYGKDWTLNGRPQQVFSLPLSPLPSPSGGPLPQPPSQLSP